MKRKNFKNKQIEILNNDILNTIEYLEQSKLIYYFSGLNIQEYQKDGHKFGEISWYNHVGGRLNCGKSFSTLDQYEYILKNNSYTLTLFDGSIIRISFKFKDKILISSSQLWWPSPFDNIDIDPELELIDYYDIYKSDKEWFKNIKMRSPVRIDYDSANDTEIHPASHMHTQHHECRIKVNKPLCFNAFISFIFKNFYPYKSLDYKNLTRRNFNTKNLNDKDKDIIMYI